MKRKKFFLRFPGGRDRALTLSYDDGVDQDIRLAKILNAHGIKCTFNINSGSFSAEGTVFSQGNVHRRMTERQAYELYANGPHEIAVHTSLHPFLTELSPEMITQEVLSDRVALEKLFGRIVRGMAYPYGATDSRVIECLKACGIAYSRTTVSTERFDLPSDWLRLPATCHHKNARLMELAEAFVGPSKSERPRLFYLWGHSYEFEENDNWDVIERFAEFMGGRDEIWYATNIEIYDYIECYKRLIWSADGDRVCNPSAQTVWISVDGTKVSVNPGETLCLYPEE